MTARYPPYSPLSSDEHFAMASASTRALITGATGFLGRHLLETMTERGGWSPTALVRTPGSWERYDWTDAVTKTRIVRGSLADVEALEQAGEFDDVEVIFHLAGLVDHSRANPEPMYRTNVDGTLAMVRAAAATGSRLIVASTSGTVGCFEYDGVTADEHAPFCDDVVGDWPYYASKIEMERRARALADELGVQMSFVRPPILFGPGDHRVRSTGILLNYLREKIPALPNGKADFTDVRDVAHALIALADHPDPRPVYHLPGTAVRIEKLFEMCREVTGVEPPRTDIPSPLLRGVCLAGDWLSQHVPSAPLPDTPDPVFIEMAAHFWDCSSLWAADELGFEARPPYQTLADSFQWLREHVA